MQSVTNSSSLKNLALLWWLRLVAILGQIVAIFITQQILHIPLPIAYLGLVLILLVAVNEWTRWRIKNASYISDTEFFFQLVIDIFALSIMLYFTGGATNPFATLFILQVVIAAIALPAFYTWIAVAMTITAYTVLLFWKIDLGGLHHHEGEFFNLHIYGMWLSFSLLAVMVGWFVVRINRMIRKQDTLLAEAEKMTAMGIFATNAVHELGTPLATLMVLAEDYSTPLHHDERDKKGKIFIDQLMRCRHILSKITAAGGVMRAENSMSVILKDFFKEVFREWHKHHPALTFEQIIEGDDSISVVIDESFRQAIVNILDNAADASSAWVKCNVVWTMHSLKVKVEDCGGGILPSIEEKLGEVGVTSKSGGLGMGIFLTKMVVNRLNGVFTIDNNIKSGVTVTIELPLKEIMI